MADIATVSIGGLPLLPAPQRGSRTGTLPAASASTATRPDCLQIVLAVAPPASADCRPTHSCAHNSTASASDRSGSPLRGMNSWAMNPVNPVSRIARTIAG